MALIVLGLGRERHQLGNTSSFMLIMENPRGLPPIVIAGLFGSMGPNFGEDVNTQWKPTAG